MRLIDADGSYTVTANDNTGYSLGFCGGIISVADDLGRILAEFDADDAPTIDAVPLVRCMVCKHRNPENAHCDHPMGTTLPVPRKLDDFCSYGERKAYVPDKNVGHIIPVNDLYDEDGADVQNT